MSFSFFYDLVGKTKKGQEFLKFHFKDQASLKTKLSMKTSGIATTREVLAEKPYSYRTTVNVSSFAGLLLKKQVGMLQTTITQNFTEILEAEKIKLGKDVTIEFKVNE